MKKRINLIIIALISSFALVSCYNYPGNKGDAFDQLVSISQWNTNYVAADYSTYCMPDSICFLTGKDQRNYVKRSKSQTVDALLTSIEKNMAAYGYTKVADTLNPDLRISPTYIDKTYVTAYQPAGYYDPFWGYYSYYYPYYMPIYYSTYSVGAFVFEMGVIAGDKLNVEFRGSVRMLYDEPSTNLSNLKSCVSECFKQAPILDKKK